MARQLPSDRVPSELIRKILGREKRHIWIISAQEEVRCLDRRSRRLGLRVWARGGLSALLVMLAACEATDPGFQQIAGQVSGLLTNAVGAGINYPSFSEEDELRLAQQNAEKIEAQLEERLEGKGTTKDFLTTDYVSRAKDPLLEDYLTSVTQRIVGVAKQRPFPYRTRIVMSPDVNAFTPGGGFIYIHAGLLARIENEDQLAFILAHEIAHVTERHLPRGIESKYGMQTLGGIAAAVVGQAPGLGGQAPEKGLEYAMSAAVNGYGRQLEAEADAVGLGYMAKAGYDPAMAAQTLKVLLDYYGDPPPLKSFFYSNHPTTEARIVEVTELSASLSKDPRKGSAISITQEFSRRTHKVVLATAALDYERGRYRTAEHLFERALLVEGDDMVPHYYLGRLELETGQGAELTAQAVGHLATAVSLNPKFPPAYRYLGLAHKRLGHDRKAADAFRQYLALAPDAVDAEAIRQAVSELSAS